MQDSGRVGNKLSKHITIGPDDIFEIELESDVPMLFAFVNQSVNEVALRLNTSREFMEQILIEAGIHDNGHHRHMLAPGSVDDQ
jgi:hypothetical protein